MGATAVASSCRVQCGGSPLPQAALFVSGDKLVAFATGEAVSVWTVSSSQRAKTLQPPSANNSANNAQIAALETAHSNNFALFAAHKDGAIRLWDVSDALLLKHWFLRDNISHFVKDPTAPDHFFVTCVSSKSSSTSSSIKSEKRYRVDRVCLKLIDSKKPSLDDRFEINGEDETESESVVGKEKKVGGIVTESVISGIKHEIVAIAVGAAIFAAGTEKYLYLVDRRENKMGVSPSANNTESVVKKIPLPRTATSATSPPKITCIAAHPTSPSLAVGLSSGEILIHHNPFFSTSSTATTAPVQILHWHFNPVSTLAYSHSGLTLLSGGKEGVLVLWHVPTLTKKTVPRLAGGAGLMAARFSNSDGEVAVVCGDACVRVVNVVSGVVGGAGGSGDAVVAKFVGLKACPLSSSSSPSIVGGGKLGFAASETSGMIVDPRSGWACVVRGGKPGLLQFWDVWKGVAGMEVEIIAENRVVVLSGDKEAESVSKRRGNVNNEDEEGETRFARVRLVAFEGAGQRKSRWMATVDERDGRYVAGGEPEVCLKFWCWDDVKQTYTVNTRVTSPHDSTITSIHFYTLPNPDSTTTSDLHCVTTSLDGTFKTWVLEPPSADSRDTSPSWTQKWHGFHRDAPVYSAATSKDASMLAVACGSVVTLWDPVTNTLCATLCHAVGGEHVTHLEFVESGGSEEESAAGPPCLVAVTSAGKLYVWNLLTGTVWWSVELGGRGGVLAVDPEGTGLFAVTVGITKGGEKENIQGADSGVEIEEKEEWRKRIVETRVVEFGYGSPVPKRVCRVDGQVRGVQYFRRSQLPAAFSAESGAHDDAERLVVLNSRGEIVSVRAPPSSKSKSNSSEAVVDAVASASEVIAGASAVESSGLFSGIYGEAAFQGTAAARHVEATEKRQQSALAVKTTREISSVESSRLSFMGAASHLLPPPVKLAGAFFDAVLKKRNIGQEGMERAMYGLSLGDLRQSEGQDQAMEEADDEASAEQEVENQGFNNVATHKDVEGMDFLAKMFKEIAVNHGKEAHDAQKTLGPKDAKLVTMTITAPAPAAATPASSKHVGKKSSNGKAAANGAEGKAIGAGTSGSAENPIIIDDSPEMQPPVSVGKKRRHQNKKGI